MFKAIANQPRSIKVLMVRDDNGEPLTGITPANVTPMYFKKATGVVTSKTLDGANFVEIDATNFPGIYNINFTTSEMNELGDFNAVIKKGAVHAATYIYISVEKPEEKEELQIFESEEGEDTSVIVRLFNQYGTPVSGILITDIEITVPGQDMNLAVNDGDLDSLGNGWHSIKLRSNTLKKGVTPIEIRSLSGSAFVDVLLILDIKDATSKKIGSLLNFAAMNSYKLSNTQYDNNLLTSGVLRGWDDGVENINGYEKDHIKIIAEYNEIGLCTLYQANKSEFWRSLPLNPAVVSPTALSMMDYPGFGILYLVANGNDNSINILYGREYSQAVTIGASPQPVRAFSSNKDLKAYCGDNGLLVISNDLFNTTTTITTNAAYQFKDVTSLNGNIYAVGTDGTNNIITEHIPSLATDTYPSNPGTTLNCVESTTSPTKNVLIAAGTGGIVRYFTAGAADESVSAFSTEGETFVDIAGGVSTEVSGDFNWDLLLVTVFGGITKLNFSTSGAIPTLTWSYLSIGLPGTPKNVHHLGNNEFIAVCQDGEVWRTKDTGTTWTADPMPEESAIISLSASPGLILGTIGTNRVWHYTK